ncbi:MAG: DUF2304 family protein [Nanoarchaeota archaeon]|nr:DUF2304 family protein [Nanoarchaeota archaeon]
MITIVQLLTFLFATFAASRAVLRAKDKKISAGELIFWLGIWGGLVFVVFFPQITSKVADIVGIGRGVDVFVYISISLLFYLIFRLYVKIEETEGEVTKLVRELALRKKK